VPDLLPGGRLLTVLASGDELTPPFDCGFILKEILMMKKIVFADRISLREAKDS
jgi:hypothetical protein